MKDREFVARLIERAKRANCSALVVTMDLQTVGQRHKDIRNGAPSSSSTLPAIVEAVGRRIEVHMDGGIRSGQDVLKALALGA